MVPKPDIPISQTFGLDPSLLNLQCIVFVTHFQWGTLQYLKSIFHTHRSSISVENCRHSKKYRFNDIELLKRIFTGSIGSHVRKYIHFLFSKISYKALIKIAHV
jgi:hypothetical protein